MEQIVFAQISDAHIGRRLIANTMTSLWGFSGDPWDLCELRSAAALAGPAAPGAHGFWVHRIALPDGAKRPQWTSWKYQTGTPFDFELDDPNGTVNFPV